MPINSNEHVCKPNIPDELCKLNLSPIVLPLLLATPVLGWFIYHVGKAILESFHKGDRGGGLIGIVFLTPLQIAIILPFLMAISLDLRLYEDRIEYRSLWKGRRTLAWNSIREVVFLRSHDVPRRDSKTKLARIILKPLPDPDGRVGEIKIFAVALAKPDEFSKFIVERLNAKLVDTKTARTLTIERYVVG